MPTQPQSRAPEPSTKPAQPPADVPPSDPDAAAAKPAGGGTLFHLLVERGWEGPLAYTAEQRMKAMTSETATATLQPMLAGLATKADLQQVRETMVTKAELQAELVALAAKSDARLDKLEINLRRDMAERETRLVKWIFGAMLLQTAIFLGFVVAVVPLLK